MYRKFCRSECNTICLCTDGHGKIGSVGLPRWRMTPSVSGQLLWEESCTLLHNMTSVLLKASCQQLEDPSSWKKSIETAFDCSSKHCIFERKKTIPHNEISTYKCCPQDPHLSGVRYQLDTRHYPIFHILLLFKYRKICSCIMSLLATCAMHAITVKMIQENIFC